MFIYCGALKSEKFLPLLPITSFIQLIPNNRPKPRDLNYINEDTILDQLPKTQLKDIDLTEDQIISNHQLESRLHMKKQQESLVSKANYHQEYFPSNYKMNYAPDIETDNLCEKNYNDYQLQLSKQNFREAIKHDKKSKKNKLSDIIIPTFQNIGSYHGSLDDVLTKLFKDPNTISLGKYYQKRITNIDKKIYDNIKNVSNTLLDFWNISKDKANQLNKTIKENIKSLSFLIELFDEFGTTDAFFPHILLNLSKDYSLILKSINTMHEIILKIKDESSSMLESKIVSLIADALNKLITIRENIIIFTSTSTKNKSKFKLLFKDKTDMLDKHKKMINQSIKVLQYMYYFYTTNNKADKIHIIQQLEKLLLTQDVPEKFFITYFAVLVKHLGYGSLQHKNKQFIFKTSNGDKLFIDYF